MKRALISVSDKAGVVAFANALVEQGYQIISTGGTQQALEAEGIPVIGVSDITGFPECLNGRVKTLHPNILAGLLANKGNANHMDQLQTLHIDTIELLVCNLYPFKETIAKAGVTLADAIENIDIGGPTMLRAAAKNYQDVTVLTDNVDYDKVLAEIKKNGKPSVETNFALAAKVFAHTAAYDCLIADYLAKQTNEPQFPQTLTMTFEKIQDMRYGENPHQSAAYYQSSAPQAGALASALQIHGKALSFNNISDTQGALSLLKEFDAPTVVACKHGNPCGVGSGATIHDAYIKTYTADPVSIFGGIVVANREIDGDTAAQINEIFIEILLAPSFSKEALGILTQKKNIRLLQLSDMNTPSAHGALEMKTVSGGLLCQSVDDMVFQTPELGAQWTIVTKKAPSASEMDDLIFTWKTVKHVKSNAIALGKNAQSVGIGAGQVNRIWACKQAIEHGTSYLGAEHVGGSVLASDAFFPFPDCVEEAAKAGITAIIQPGGSLQDAASIEACDKYNIAMVFTNMRHFKHS